MLPSSCCPGRDESLDYWDLAGTLAARIRGAGSRSLGGAVELHTSPLVNSTALKKASGENVQDPKVFGSVTSISSI